MKESTKETITIGKKEHYLSQRNNSLNQEVTNVVLGTVIAGFCGMGGLSGLVDTYQYAQEANGTMFALSGAGSVGLLGFGAWYAKEMFSSAYQANKRFKYWNQELNKLEERK